MQSLGQGGGRRATGAAASASRGRRTKRQRPTPTPRRAANGRLRFSPGAAYRHLRSADPVVGDLIDQFGPYRPRPSPDPYGALVRTILFQQLAGAAASAIMRRVFAIFGDEERTPTPHDFLHVSEADLRAAGLSRQKTSYLRDLAKHVADGCLDFEALASLEDTTVVDQLTAVRGLGEWSAQMFLMFHLGRPDVLPVGDLGVRKGMQTAYGLRKEPSRKRAQQIGAPWAPYRSVGSWYMWRAMDTVTPD